VKSSRWRKGRAPAPAGGTLGSDGMASGGRAGTSGAGTAGGLGGTDRPPHAATASINNARMAAILA
jgi:hypothetical protein